MPVSRILSVDRHRLGLRLFVFERRIHEWHVGLAVLAAAAVAGWLGLVAPAPRSSSR